MKKKGSKDKGIDLRIQRNMEGSYVECYCLPAPTIHAVSNVTFPAPTFTVLYVKSHSEINTSGLAGWRLAEQATAKVSCSKTFVLVNSVYTNNVLNA